MAASHFAETFGETEIAAEYADGAAKIRAAMEKNLYLPEEKRFARMVRFSKSGKVEVDATLDASLYGIFAFGAFRADEPMVKETMQQLFTKLEVNGGITLYEQDSYFRKEDQSSSNPWFIATLWKAQYKIAVAKTREELDEALSILEWVADRALPSGVLAEQIDAETNEPTSVSPLTWSHGTYIAAVQEYLTKLLDIEKCPTCGFSKYSKNR
jgi:GH15 family glucan-1,4-alpha-glucosidase